MAAVPVAVPVAADRPPPPGAPPGGTYSVESYSGTTTLIIMVVLILIFWPALCAPFCCPCDSRQVYIVNGTKYVPSGAVVPVNDCCGNPCGGPAA